jgi:hypothetical protein
MAGQLTGSACPLAAPRLGGTPTEVVKAARIDRSGVIDDELLDFQPVRDFGLAQHASIQHLGRGDGRRGPVTPGDDAGREASRDAVFTRDAYID